MIIRLKVCRKRKIQTLILVLVIVVLYYLLQFFSLSKLGSSEKKVARDKVDMSAFEVHDGQKDNLSDDAMIPDSIDVRHQKQAAEALPRGVHTSDAALYAVDSSGHFKCLNSKLYIPADRVNDDFCDCPDSSDEPGTSACPNGRFYCKVQLPHEEAQYVHSSKVNDGLCDCCDGSDEWQRRSVPSPMQLHGKSGAVFHTPCTDRCGDVLKLMEHEEQIRRTGILLQKRYLEAARSLTSQRQKYGPAGIFYLLSQDCYDHKAPEYVYTVCPFQSVKQSRGGSATFLGRQGYWSRHKSGDHMLEMTGGDASLCPDGKPRETQIRFLCGLEDQVISVNEDQKCRYIVRFSSPAAC